MIIKLIHNTSNNAPFTHFLRIYRYSYVLVWFGRKLALVFGTTETLEQTVLGRCIEHGEIVARRMNERRRY